MDFSIVQEIIADVLQLDPEQITKDMNFEKDLGANSLDRVEIIMNLEDRLNIEIPDEALENIETVGDAIAQIEELVKQ